MSQHTWLQFDPACSNLESFWFRPLAHSEPYTSTELFSAALEHPLISALPSFCSGVLCQAWLRQQLRTDQRPTISRAAGGIILRKVPLLPGRQGSIYSPETQRTKVDVTSDRLSSPSTGNPLSCFQRKPHRKYLRVHLEEKEIAPGPAC